MENELYFEIIKVQPNFIISFNKFYTSEKQISIIKIIQIIYHKLNNESNS
jgi:hypothetical protein